MIEESECIKNNDTIMYITEIMLVTYFEYKSGIRESAYRVDLIFLIFLRHEYSKQPIIKKI